MLSSDLWIMSWSSSHICPKSRSRFMSWPLRMTALLGAAMQHNKALKESKNLVTRLLVLKYHDMHVCSSNETVRYQQERAWSSKWWTCGLCLQDSHKWSSGMHRLRRSTWQSSLPATSSASTLKEERLSTRQQSIFKKSQSTDHSNLATEDTSMPPMV